MSGHRRSFRGRHVVGALLGILAMAGAYALPVVISLERPVVGSSVHAKNSDTPGWMLELETRNARQLPVVQKDKPSFWI